MTDKKGFDVDEQSWHVSICTYGGCTLSMGHLGTHSHEVAEPAKEVQPAKARGEMKSPTGKWLVTMKRNGKPNKAVVNADSEWNAMFVAETIHGHKGWVSSNAVPAMLIKRTMPLKSREEMTEQLKEVQPSVQFEEWLLEFSKALGYANSRSLLGNEIYCARAAWQAALAAQSAPVDWKKVVREKFPDARIEEEDSGTFVWSSKTPTPVFLGYSWQHAAHHPQVVGK